MTKNTIQLSELAPTEGVAELHVHLGGSVPIHRLFEAAVDRGIHLPVSSYEEFSQLLHRRKDNSGSLEKYLEIYEVAERIQSGPSAVRESVLIALNGAARTGGSSLVSMDGEALAPQRSRIKLHTVELRFNPMKRNNGGIWDLDRVFLAASAAVDEIHTAYKGQLEAGLIVCLGRDLPWEQNLVLAEKVAKWSEDGLPVVGIDLAGAEHACTLENPEDLAKMADFYRLAGSLVGRTVHCGETRHIGIETFINTLEQLEVQRVGHPLSAARAYWEQGDDRGLKLMAEREIIAELCVVSNLLTGAFEEASDYRRLLDLLDEFGVGYAFSTDAPALQKTTLASELQLLLDSGGATADQIRRSFKVANKATFIGKDRVKKTGLGGKVPRR